MPMNNKTSAALSGAKVSAPPGLFVKHREAADRIAKRASHEYIRDKVGGQSDAGEAHNGCKAVCGIRNPFMIAVAPRNHSRDGEGRDGMAGWKAAMTAEKRSAAVKPGVGIILAW